MAGTKRSDDWGFPRWRPYGKSRDATNVRVCDRDGCTAAGDRPAPKRPNSPERWYFCETHAAEYNRNWDYFTGLDAETAAAREADESAEAAAFRQAQHWQWGGPGDGSRSRDEMRALEALELDGDADFARVKAAYRRLAKANHPDLKPDDELAAKRFQQVKAAYDVLRRVEERREGRPAKPHQRSR
jgi:curved DNA-binding protein CbpA